MLDGAFNTQGTGVINLSNPTSLNNGSSFNKLGTGTLNVTTANASLAANQTLVFNMALLGVQKQ